MYRQIKCCKMGYYLISRGYVMSIVLTSNEPETEVFDLLGDCYICAKGEGQIKIMRDIGSGFEVVTNDRGEELIFAGTGVLYNHHITTKKRLKHKIVAETTKEIVIDMVKERN